MPEIAESGFEQIRRNKVYEEVAKQLERMILTKLRPGDKLPSERELAEMLGERAYLFTRAALISDEGLLMTPRRTDTDGFFVSLLRRTG